MGRLYKSACYCTNLRRSAGALSAFYDASLHEVGLSAAQYYLLINLSRLGSANITHWAQHVGLERSTMVRNVKVLEAAGFIHATSGSGKTFALTEAGTRTLSAAIPVWEAAQRRMEQFLGEEDAAAILRIGGKLQELNSL